MATKCADSEKKKQQLTILLHDTGQTDTGERERSILDQTRFSQRNTFGGELKLFFDRTERMGKRSSSKDIQSD